MTQAESIFVLSLLGITLWRGDKAMKIIGGCAMTYWGVLNLDEMQYGGVLMLIGIYLVLNTVFDWIKD